MGRRKKDDVISYIQIISSSYVQKTEYEKAQIMFSNALDDYGNLKPGLRSNFLGTEEEDYWDEYEIYD